MVPLILHVVLKKYSFSAICIIVVTLFVGLRLYKLDSALLFYNDMGRDYLVLLDWAESWKPPLLGPQTSVISYNQSAWYFYILMPLFVITGHSAFASTYTLVLFALSILALTLWRLKRYRDLQWAALIVFFVLAIQPQAIWQNRFIWNPSFVPFMLLLSYGLFFKLMRDWNRFDLGLCVTGLAFAVGFNYSAAPLALIIWVLLLIFQRQHWKSIVLWSFGAGLLVIAPMLFFELKHGFVLSKLLIVGQSTPQDAIRLGQKVHLLNKFLLPTSYGLSPQLLLVFFSVVVGVALSWKKKVSQELVIAVSVALLMLGTTLLLPINIEKHYIFGLLISFGVLIAFMPKLTRLLILGLLALIWLSPQLLQPQYVRAVRTVGEMQQCYQQFCSQFREAAYVSSENGILVGYHNAPDHRFFLKEAGCEVRDIEKEQTSANYMLVIGDQARFDPIKSAYRELTLFGTYQLIQTHQCQPGLDINLIRNI